MAVGRLGEESGELEVFKVRALQIARRSRDPTRCLQILRSRVAAFINSGISSSSVGGDEQGTAVEAVPNLKPPVEAMGVAADSVGTTSNQMEALEGYLGADGEEKLEPVTAPESAKSVDPVITAGPDTQLEKEEFPMEEGVLEIDLGCRSSNTVQLWIWEANIDTEMAFSLLSEIHKDSHQWTVCVLVSRMWHYRGGTDDGPIKHTDLVLLDTEGTHMYGQIPAGTANRLKHVLKEGKVYVIRKFLCNPSRPAYRPVESPFMLQFTRYTIVEERPVLEDTYPFCTYSLTSFADIPDPSGPPTRFIDVIGKISMVSDVLPVQSMLQSTASNTRTIMLTDLLGNEVRLVLWGDRAVEFDAETVRAMGEKEPVIAIFVGTLPKSYRGVRGLSGSSACRWYIDEDIPDVNSFRESLGKQFTPLAAYVPIGSDALTSRVYQNPVDKTVEQLANLDPFVDMDKKFLCTVTVNRLGSDQRWWFSSCSTCRKSTRLDGYQFKCSGEGCLSIKAALTYCVSVFSSDDTGEAEFVLFDKVAAGAIGKPLMTLMRQRYPGHTRVEDIARVARLDTAIPPEITQLVGQKHKVLVCISKKWKSNNSWNSNNSEDLSFQINRIEETYKPELPALVFGVTSVSGGASSSTSGLGMQLPLLGPVTSPVQQTPPMVGSTPNQDFRPGYGSPVGQGCGTPVPRISPATPAKGSAAPKRGARRSLYMGSSSDNKEGTKENAIADEEIPDASVQTGLGDVAGTIDGKEEEVVIPKTKRNSKKQKQQ